MAISCSLSRLMDFLAAYKSHCCCKFSRNSAEILNTFSSRSGISTEMALRQFNISEAVFLDTLIFKANADTDKFMQSVKRLI